VQEEAPGQGLHQLTLPMGFDRDSCRNMSLAEDKRTSAPPTLTLQPPNPLLPQLWVSMAPFSTKWRQMGNEVPNQAGEIKPGQDPRCKH
jgi:hypothetical protein